MCVTTVALNIVRKINEFLNETINVDLSNERKSRPRICDIDRATVLSINRKLVCRHRRELSWPPINNRNKVDEKFNLPTKYTRSTISKMYVRYLMNIHQVLRRKTFKSQKRIPTKLR